MAYKIGDRVGDYEITGVLGAGGMGQVYRVKNTLTDRVEAMKVLLPSLTENVEVMDRFLREIKVLGSLDHPNIAALRTAQRIDNQVVMIMEYIEGKSLDALLHQGAVRREFGLSFIAQVLAALEYAHARGIVHRDIKPANVMVTASGLVKLMDFGIAKLNVDRKLTATGSTLGSLYYMSPEQIQGAESVDARSDLYAVGICLYEVATGQRPFDATSEYSLMSKHLHESPRPPIQLDPTIPDSLNQIILMTIAKDPGQRFQTSTAMLAALNSVRKELGFKIADGGLSGAAAQPGPKSAAQPTSSPVSPPPTAPRSRRGLYMAAGSLVTAGVVIAALLLVPKYLKTGAAGNQTPATPVPAISTPSPVPAAQPSSAAVPETNPVPPASKPAEPVPAPSAKPAPLKPAKQPVSATSALPTGGEPPAPQMPPPQAQPRPADTPKADNARAQQAALNEVREEYNQLAIRAGTSKSGLQGIQNQMGGLNLRADIRETAARVDYLMNEAKASLQAGDVENARRNLSLADRAVEKIEKFLGR